VEDGDEEDAERDLDEHPADGVGAEDPGPVLETEEREREVVEVAEEQRREADGEVLPVSGLVLPAHEEGRDLRQKEHGGPEEDGRIHGRDVERVGDDAPAGGLGLVVEVEAREGDVEAQGDEDVDEGRDRDDHPEDAVVVR